MRVYDLRLRLARRIAPAPIMVDPFPGDSTVVFIREGKSQVTLKAETFEMTFTNSMRPQFLRADEPWNGKRPERKFHGTLA